MIKSLQKRISTLFIFLLTIIWLVILFLFINNSYRNNLSDLQQTVRAALHYMIKFGWRGLYMGCLRYFQWTDLAIRT